MTAVPADVRIDTLVQVCKTFGDTRMFVKRSATRAFALFDRKHTQYAVVISDSFGSEAPTQATASFVVREECVFGTNNCRCMAPSLCSVDSSGSSRCALMKVATAETLQVPMPTLVPFCVSDAIFLEVCSQTKRVVASHAESNNRAM